MPKVFEGAAHYVLEKEGNVGRRQEESINNQGIELIMALPVRKYLLFDERGVIKGKLVA